MALRVETLKKTNMVCPFQNNICTFFLKLLFFPKRKKQHAIKRFSELPVFSAWNEWKKNEIETQIVLEAVFWLRGYKLLKDTAKAAFFRIFMKNSFTKELT